MYLTLYLLLIPNNIFIKYLYGPIQDAEKTFRNKKQSTSHNHSQIKMTLVLHLYTSNYDYVIGYVENIHVRHWKLLSMYNIRTWFNSSNPES